MKSTDSPSLPRNEVAHEGRYGPVAQLQERDTSPNGTVFRQNVAEHLFTEELEDRYRKARDPVARSHYQIVWLLSSGKLTREVTEATGYSP